VAELIFNKNCSSSDLTTLDLTAILRRGTDLSRYAELFSTHFENALGDATRERQRNFHYLKMFYYTFFDHAAYTAGQGKETNESMATDGEPNDCAGHLRSWGLMNGTDEEDDEEEPYEDKKYTRIDK